MEGPARLIALADTGALLALIDREEGWHTRVRDWWARQHDDVRVPAVVLPEICYLLQKRLGSEAEVSFVRAVTRGEFVLEPSDQADLYRVAGLMETYSDLRLGFVDASIVAMAERLDIRELLTTDRRHFGVVRPAHCERLRLLP